MGQLATSLDWTHDLSADEDDARPSASRSGVCPRAEVVDDDEPTRPLLRLVTRACAEPVRDGDRAVERLAALVAWIAKDDADDGVAAFGREVLARVAELDEATRALEIAVDGAPAIGLREGARAAMHAVAVWRANVVEYADELALLRPRSLRDWSGLAEYSAMVVLAVVTPALRELESWTFSARCRGIDLAPVIDALEAAIVALNWTLGTATLDAIGDAGVLVPLGAIV